MERTNSNEFNTWWKRTNVCCNLKHTGWRTHLQSKHQKKKKKFLKKKFIVDDLYKIDQNQPKKLDGSGNIHNVIIVTENGQQQQKEKEKEEEKEDSKMQEVDILEMKNEEDQDDGFGQIEHVFVESKKNPPTVPPHLRYTPLNSTAPTHDHDPTIVPIPLMVTLNHTYFTESQDLEAIGITSRFREKYSTVVLYKPKVKVK